MSVTKDQVEEALSAVNDPELGHNIVDLGLVYRIDIEGSKIDIDMTMTSMGCPIAAQLLAAAKMIVEQLPGVEEVTMNLVWKPQWTPDMMKEELRWLYGR